MTPRRRTVEPRRWPRRTGGWGKPQPYRNYAVTTTFTLALSILTMSGDVSPPTSLSESHRERPNPKVWGRRAYLNKPLRERANDASRAIAQTRPDHVDDPADPALSDVFEQLVRGVDPAVKGSLLVDLMSRGLDFREAVCWYWYRHAQFDITEIYFAKEGFDKGGDPERRADHVAGIIDTLRSAASKLDVDADLPDPAEKQ